MKELIGRMLAGAPEVEEIEPHFGQLDNDGEEWFDEVVKDLFPPTKKKLSYRLEKKKKIEDNLRYIKSLNELRRKEE